MQRKSVCKCLEVPIHPRRRVPSLEVTMAEVEGYHCLLCEQVQPLMLVGVLLTVSNLLAIVMAMVSISRCLSADSTHQANTKTVADHQDLSVVLDSSEEASQIKQTGQAMLEALRLCIQLMKDVQGGTKAGHTLSHQPSQPTPQISKAGHTLSHQPSQPTPLISKEQKDNQQDCVYSTKCKAMDSENSSEAGEAGSILSSDEFFDVVENPEQTESTDIEEDQEFYSEEDNISSGISQNRSVVMHVLSQVRVGMDITRITLPAFILEKRSQLEMYSESLAHPQLLSRICDQKNPKDRFIATLKWYLCSFEATLKGAVAKKPYNPILGETFDCYWDLPNDTTTPVDEKSQKILDSGPVPYARYNSITFVAEQVSHHPPISGFYCESPSMGFYINASILLKTKFLGFSVGVYNIGTIHLHLLNFGEEYVLTTPNVYARSVLTTPWLEVGGKSQIQCLQTGYTADMEFHSKPFYGGRKHRVNAEVHHVMEKKPVLKVEGEWNGVLFAHHPNGNQEVFLNPPSIPTIRKKLKKLSAQDPGESRKRWQSVTEALKCDDLEAAAEAKHVLEEKQRADTRERQQLGIEWTPKYFHAAGDSWVYNSPLDSRLQQLGLSC